MPRYVALLRGINVGRAKRIAMADLKALFEGLGCSDVRTLLNSGNVILTAPAGVARTLGERAEKGLEARLGVSSRVTILTEAEVRVINAAEPLGAKAEADPGRLLVCVLADPKDRAKLVPLTKNDWTPEAIALGARVAYAHCPAGIIDSAVMKAVGKALGDRVTSRNRATLRKIEALL